MARVKTVLVEAAQNMSKLSGKSFNYCMNYICLSNIPIETWIRYNENFRRKENEEKLQNCKI